MPAVPSVGEVTLPPGHWRKVVVVAASCIALVIGAYSVGARWDLLFSGSAVRSAARVFTGMLQPDIEPEFLTRVGQLMLESMAIGFLGMALALIVGVPLALVSIRLPELEASQGTGGRVNRIARLCRRGARMTLAALRAVPEIVWAFIFVRMLGLGPGPAVMAIGLTFGGILGKLFADLLETVDPAPVRALLGSGSHRLVAFVFGVLPQVKTQLVGYGLIRFECALRSAAILGMVGAGGIGAEIALSIRYLQMDKLATSLLALIATIAIFEAIAAWLRPRPARWSLALLTFGGFVSMAYVGVDLAALFAPDAKTQAVQFLADMWPPNSDASFVANHAGSALQTVVMALVATAGAALVATLLAPWASRLCGARGFLPDAPTGGGLNDLLKTARLLSVRAVLLLSRAIPDLVWALLFVLWVGPGMFAGVLAVGAHTVGLLGRLYAESYEDIDPRAAAAMQAQGAAPLTVWGMAVLPQAGARLAAFSIYRFEVNVRATAIIGFVGAGGLGDAIHTAIALFHGPDLLTLLGLLLLTVWLVDLVGDALRWKLLPLHR